MKESVNPLFFYTFIKTRSDATELHEQLTVLTGSLFTTKDSIETILGKTLAYSKVQLLKQLAKEYKINMEDKIQLQELIKQFDTKVMSLPVVQLTVAIDPKIELIDAIHHWFYQVFKQPVLLDIAVNSTLIGGSEIRFNGRMADYSLRKLINEKTNPAK